MPTENTSMQAARIAPAFVAYYGLLGVLQPFLPPVLLERGLTNEQAGMVQGTAALLSSIAPLLASRLLGPRVAPRTMARIFGMGVTVMALVLAMAARTNPMLWAGAVIVFALTWSPIAAIIDTLAVAATHTGKLTYGQLRMSGSVGFILASSLLGWIIGANMAATLDISLVVACVFMLATTWMLPNVGDRVAQADTPTSTGVQVPRYMYILLAAMALHWCPFGAYQYSYTMLAKSVGLRSGFIGIAWSLGVISEVACFLLSARLIRHLGWHRVMLIAFGAAWARWLLIALFPQAPVVVLTQLLHGPGFAWFYTAAMAAIAGAGRGATAVMLQGLFTGLVTGMGACLGNFWAGWACGHMPIHQLFLMAIPTQIVALALLSQARAPTDHDSRITGAPQAP